MNNEWVVLTLLVLLGVVVSLVCHFLTKNYLFAAASASVISAIVVQVSNFVYLGYFDPFSVFAFPAAVLLYFLLAAVVGLPFAIVRKRRGERILIPQGSTK